MSAPDTEIVEARLARVRSLLFAFDMIAERDAGFDLRGAFGFLRMMAVEELDKVTEVQKGEALDRHC